MTFEKSKRGNNDPAYQDRMRHQELLAEEIAAEAASNIQELSIPLISGSDDDTIKIKVPVKREFRFRYGSAEHMMGRAFGVSQGDGVKTGSVVRVRTHSEKQAGKKEPGKKEVSVEGNFCGSMVGTGVGEVTFEKTVKLRDIRQHLSRRWGLPDLKDKIALTLRRRKSILRGIARIGPESRRHLHRMAEARISRLSSRDFNSSPFLDADERVKRTDTVDVFHSAAVIYLVRDTSGSISQSALEVEITLLGSYFLPYLKELHPEGVILVFITHTGEAREWSSEQEFLALKSSGGTKMSSALKLVQEKIDKYYPLDAYNHYVFYLSDGQNEASDDADFFKHLQRLCGQVNLFAYFEIFTISTIVSRLKNIQQTYANLMIAKIERKEDVLKALEGFLRNMPEEENDSAGL